MVKERKETANSDLGGAVDFARRALDINLDWYRNADTKAEILLSLDGVFLAFVTSSIFMKRDDLAGILDGFTNWTWFLLSMMCVALATSILCAIGCIWSRIPLSNRAREQYFAERNIHMDKLETYLPEATLFFQKISWLDSELYQKLLLSVTPSFEIRALAADLHTLAGNLVKKHRLVDVGFFLTGVSLLLLLASGISYLMAITFP
jgi:hypothetical protein